MYVKNANDSDHNSSFIMFILHTDCLELLESVWNRQLKKTGKSLIVHVQCVKKAAICILFATCQCSELCCQ